MIKLNSSVYNCLKCTVIGWVGCSGVGVLSIQSSLLKLFIPISTSLWSSLSLLSSLSCLLSCLLYLLYLLALSLVFSFSCTHTLMVNWELLSFQPVLQGTPLVGVGWGDLCNIITVIQSTDHCFIQLHANTITFNWPFTHALSLPPVHAITRHKHDRGKWHALCFKVLEVLYMHVLKTYNCHHHAHG